MRSWACLAPLAVAGLLHSWAASSPGLVEREYSRGAYPWIAAALGRVNRLLPFAVADALPLLALGLASFAAWRLARALRVRGWRALGAALRAVAWATGLAYLGFLAAWGLNYRREPLASSLGLSVAASSPAELEELGEELVSQANRLRAGRAEREGVFTLTRGRWLAAPYPRAQARAKMSLMSPALARLGISGIFVPFTGEALLNGLLPDSELPFSAAHELAHAQGWAREDEANFLAVRACRSHDDPDFRYSGVLAASRYVVAALAAADRSAAGRLGAARSGAVRRDIEAIRRYQERYEGRLARAGERLNDAYLRSQGQPQGVRSYGHMVDLLLAERRARLAP